MTFRSVKTLLLLWTLSWAALAAETPALGLDGPQDSTKFASNIRPGDVIQWEPIEGQFDPAGNVVLTLRLSTKDDFTLYHDKVTFQGPPGFTVVEWVGPPETTIIDPMTGDPAKVYTGGDFQVHFSGLEPFQGDEFPVSITFVGCTTKICLFPHTEILPVRVFPSAEAAITRTESQKNTQADSTDGESYESLWARQINVKEISPTVLGLVFLGGVATNLTPCVFPMIPITIRLLASQGSVPLVSSALYAGGIMVTYTGLGVAAALSGAIFGAFMANPWFGVGFGVLMLLLGATMLGFGNFGFLQSVGSRFGAGGPSKWNSFLMGTGAGLVAAPCTGPILALLLAYTAEQQDIGRGTLLLFIYALGFALPYVFLGGIAARLGKIRAPYHLQITVKYLFAAIMFGLALYYLRIPAYALVEKAKPFWFPVGLAATAAGISLCALWLVQPRLHMSKALSIIPTFILGIGLFAFSQHLASAPSAKASASVAWIKSEAEALAQGKASGKPILIDSWAEWCEACKKMDRTTFVDPQVVSYLSEHYVLLKLDFTLESDETAAWEEKYQIMSLPTLVMLPPDGDVAKMKKIEGFVTAPTILNEAKSFADAHAGVPASP